MKYLILILLTACAGKSGGGYVEGHSSPELEKYIAEFEDTFDVDVNFEVALVPSLSSGSANDGECIHPGAFRRVEIKEAKGKKLRLLVFHELGHCALGIDHWDEEFDVMNTRPNLLVWADIENLIPQMVENYEAGIYPRL